MGSKPRKWSDLSRLIGQKNIAWLQRSDGRVILGIRNGKQIEPLFLLTRQVRLKGGIDLVATPQRHLNNLYAELAAHLGG